ncbi:DedA family protein [Acidithiobacillus thiooxidans]|uniref:DedA family protein n=1 Tax=Acidithiobacillus thiooxidans TaxID=930 RepID=UPI0004E18031|nr:DedA family protein [Acidithiobacillus thiooxidans]
MLHWFLATLATLIQSASPILRTYGLWAVFGILLIENAGVVFAPGEATLVTAGFLTAKGVFPIEEVVPVALLGCIFGGALAFWLGARYGHATLERFGKYVGIRSWMIEKSHHFFQRFGAPVVLVGRFIVPLRQLQGYLAGAAQMKGAPFMIWNGIGAACWVGAWGGAAFFLAQQIPI